MTDYDCPPDIAKIVPLRHIWNEVHENNMNQIMIINGRPRTGKSELDIAINYKLDRGTTKDFEHRFEVSKNMSWTKLDHHAKVRNFDAVGTCLQWEEAGVAELGANSREFWSAGNKAMSSLFQTMGYKRQVVGITLPARMMLDKQVRSLCHIIIDTYRVKPWKKRVVAKMLFVEASSMQKDDLLKYPRYFSGGYKYKIMSISVPQAPREVIREYKVRDALFKDWLQKKLETEEGVRVGDMLNGVAEKEEKVTSSQRLNEKLERMKQTPDIYWDKKKRKANVTAIMMLQEENRANAYTLGGLFAQHMKKSLSRKSSVINCNGVEAVGPIN